MYKEKKSSVREDAGSTEARFGEELTRRLSILQSQEDFAMNNKSEEEKLAERVDFGTAVEEKKKNVSIFRPLQRFIPSVLDVGDAVEDERPCQPSYLLMSLAVSILAGLGVGALMKLRHEPYTEREVFYIQFPGKLFERSVEIVLIPYVTSSVISSVGKLPSLVFVKIVSKILIYSILTTLSASFLGIIVSFSIPNVPGKIINNQPGYKVLFGLVEVLLDIFLNVLPNNIVYACVATEHIQISENKNVSGVIQGSFEIQTIDRTNYLGLVMFCVLIGMALRQIGNAAEWFFCLTDILTDLMAVIMSWLVWTSPVGLFFTIIGEIVSHDWGNISTTVAVFSGLYVLGLTIQCLLLLPLVFYVITFTNPFRYVYNTLFGILTGFGMSRSFSALPFVLKGLQQNNVNPYLANAILPLLATINKLSNAILCSLVASYLIRQSDLDMNLIKALQILFYATFNNDIVKLEVSLVHNLLHLARNIGLSEHFANQQLEIILSAGWLLNRLRVCGNLVGHVFGVKIIQRISGKELKLLKSKEQVDCNSMYAPAGIMNTTKTLGFSFDK